MPNPPPPTPSRAAAHHLQEQLQLSGERDRLKGWLYRQLVASGWTAVVTERAADIAEGHCEEQAITVDELSEQLKDFAYERVPEAVRVRLMRELLRVSRAFADREGVPVVTGEGGGADGGL